MKAKSMAEVRALQDFEEAKSRYEKCGSGRWKNAWWEVVCEIYSTCAEWAKKYVLDPVTKTISAVGNAVKTLTNRRKSIAKDDATIQWGECEISFLNGTRNKDTKSGEKTYFFKFYDNPDRPPVFDKIGTTNKSCLDRLKQEIRYYNKAGFGIEKVEICEIWDCGNTPAESYESFMRALLIKKFPNTWRRNDRFFGANIPTSLFQSLCAEYAAL